MESVRVLEGNILESIFLKSTKYFNVSSGVGRASWSDASSINGSYLMLDHENISEVWISFLGGLQVIFLADNGLVLVKESKSKFEESDGRLSFTYESPPVTGQDVYKILNHSCYEDYLISVMVLENEVGLAGYALQFSGQDTIYIYLDANRSGEYLLLSSDLPSGCRAVGE